MGHRIDIPKGFALPLLAVLVAAPLAGGHLFTRAYYDNYVERSWSETLPTLVYGDYYTTEASCSGGHKPIEIIRATSSEDATNFASKRHEECDITGVKHGAWYMTRGRWRRY